MVLVNIGPVEKFPVGKGVRVDLAGRAYAVFNATGQYYAIDDRCPHRGASFSQGRLVGNTVTCPLHGATADVRTGACTPPSPGAVGTYDVSCDSKALFLDVG